MDSYVPCPKCGGTPGGRLLVWGFPGNLVASLLNLVKCSSCRKVYNGKTGTKFTTYVGIFFVVVAIACLAILFVLIAALLTLGST